MCRQYTKVEILSEEVFRWKAAGETNREIGERYGLTREQVHNLSAARTTNSDRMPQVMFPARKAGHVKIRQPKNKKGRMNRLGRVCKRS